MDDSEARKKRLDELKQQSLDMEREAQEREKRAEERRKKRDEELRLLQEQEKKDEEERQRKRDERRRLREEEDRKLKEDMLKLEEERKQRQLQREKDGAGTTSSASVDDDDPELKKIREEREKRLEEKKKQREEEEKHLAEEKQKEKDTAAEKGKEEADRLEKEKEAAKAEADRLEKEKQEKEAAAKAEADRLEQEKQEKEAAAKEEADRLEKEKQEKEKEAAAKAEADRLEKEKQEKEAAEAKAAKEEADRLEKEAAAKAEIDRLEKEKQEKEKEAAAKAEADRLEKEKQEKEAAAKAEADRLEKEKQEKEAAAKAEADRLEKEKQEKEKAAKEEADRLEKERLEKDAAAKAEADRIEKEKQEKEAAKAEADRLEKEKQEKEAAAAKEEADRLEKEKQEKDAAAKAEADRLKKEKQEKEAVAKAEADRLEKEKQEKDAAAKAEADRLEKEKAAKEESDRLEKEKQEKEKAAKEEADRLEKEKKEKEAAAKAEADRLEKEKQEKEKEAAAKAEADRLEKEKKEKEAAAKAEADRLEKEKKEKQEKEAAAKAEADRLEKEKQEKEKTAKAEADRLEKEKQEKEKAAKAEADRLEKEKAANVEKQPSAKITDAFKLTIEKQLKEQMENKNNPPSAATTESSGEYTPQKLANLTLDRAKVTGRKLPSKSHKPPTARPESPVSTSPSGPSLLAQALENKPNSDSESSPVTKKKIVLPPGAAGLMGGMAALAVEAQKKKLEKDAISRLKVEEPEAPSFVRGRSQSVSVTSTMKGDTTGKFLVHKKVVDTYSGLRTRLIHCKGKKRILTREVEVTTRSLNKTDAFVLDCGVEGSGVGGESTDSNAHSTIYVWYGSKSNAAKKAKAVAIAEIIKSHERGGHATILKLDEADRDADALEFYKRMNGKPDDFIMADGGDDLEAEQTWPQSFNLLRFNQDTGVLISADIKALSIEVLASDGFFVLDTGSEFYAWSGRSADIPQFKDKFLEKSKDRLKGNNQRPPWVEMVVTSEGGEPVMFREKFFDWPDLSHEVSLSRMGFGKKRVFDVSIPYEKKSPLKMTQFEVQDMVYSEPPEEAPHRSDGTGTYELWCVDNMKIHPVPEEEHGQFYSGNCYLIRYTYSRWNALKYIIYIWQGADASRQDVGSSSLLSKDMYIETCNKGDCIQDCVRQGRENIQFYMVFNGRMVVHRGVRGEFDTKAKRLYHIYGKRDNTITAVQTTKLSATCLNSRDIFVVTDSATTYMWEGSGASKALKEQAAKLATLIVNSPSKSATAVQETKESEDFWNMLGGKAKYANDQLLKHPNSVKLFAIVNTGTIIRADEIFNFNQYELQSNRVFILDNKVKMYVWSGAKAPEKEKKRGMEIALEYIKLLKDGRKEEDVLFIKDSDEPVEFTCQFHAWDSFRSLNSNGADPEESPKVESASNLLKKYYQILPLEVLTQKNTPPEIDRSVLEMYLSDEEFQKVLGVTKSEWEVMPAWKKTDKKKTAGLF